MNIFNVNNVKLLNAVFHCLNKVDLDYCVQNNYQAMPEEIPSDIDIFYRNATEYDLDRIVLDIATICDLRVVQKTTMGYWGFVYMFNKANPKKGFQLQLDFQREFSPPNFPNVYNGDSFLNNKQKFKSFFIPQASDEIKFTLIRRIIKNDFNQSRLDYICHLYDSASDDCNHKLQEIFPKKIYDLVLQMINNKDIAIFNSNKRTFYNYVKSESKANATFSKKIKQLKFNLIYQFSSRIINPMGLTIAFISPDGGGKSTIIEAITTTCKGCFHGIEKIYFRPRLFKNLGSYKPINPQGEAPSNPDPHGVKSNGVLKSTVRFLFYNLDFLLGYFFKIYILKIKRRLIVFDRYYYDYYVDLKRYQFKLPKFLPRLFSFMIPAPDLVFILDAPAEVIYSRKQELSPEEIDRHRTKFIKISKQLKNAYLINTNQHINDVVKEVTKIIIDKKVDQTAKKIKS